LNYTKRIFKIAIPISITSYIRSGLSTLKQLLIPIGLEKFGMSYDLAFSNYGMIAGMVMPILFLPSILINS
jgi:stage V sporulation protein B